MKSTTQLLLAHTGLWLSTGIILAATLQGNTVPHAAPRERAKPAVYEVQQYYGPAQLIKDQGRRFLRNNQAAE
jgi:hypothetical protein